jgi:hypothetical protein
MVFLHEVLQENVPAHLVIRPAVGFGSGASLTRTPEKVGREFGRARALDDEFGLRTRANFYARSADEQDAKRTRQLTAPWVLDSTSDNVPRQVPFSRIGGIPK